jgi:hypothetical protein
MHPPNLENVDRTLQSIGNEQRKLRETFKNELMDKISSPKFAKLYETLLRSDPTDTKENAKISDALWKMFHSSEGE